MPIKNIAIFGFSESDPKDPLYKDAYDVSAEIAKAGYTIVNGAGPGVMRASTEGAHSSGGKVTGITFYPRDMTFFEGRDPQNKVDELYELPDYVQRTLRMLEAGDMYIIFNGGTGTLSEFAMAWALARLYFGHHKPFILYGGFWYPIMEEITRLMKIRKQELEVYKIVVEPQDVVPAIKEFEEMMEKNGDHDHEKKSPFRI
ncbi:MAG: hypothetical protein A3D24_02400 [Candidatus Blackburnbacteria bacterium RIFCSPHIGHO2_02_FULL_39_13]|uniref:Lysine decarboxylase n=1 Tax=Candidatus Blackburnbacteria bacterium RIFCSPLOWO2_01_FULL_40_20 TaxID=1797519 RepID=A0A1G1VB14_9BACT|nr:MAG: hypothetical protein UT38_C0028G0007 [Microgenomates group bacterium GW2011_GWA2_39_19]OGY07607.1 MAG: hypothetical protein A2694_02780 [Candidatus Blackburnbacteria bacterium RIFCSPHIGHO2_01_FULL_40_17]OGY09532.1 MAG: hypothetical protein A3D24_02400 [Candidatus Blackburnbacteria bacterium RIFCSPHIGHO2_02_FULL_39_13]OGY12546.1 MAG: hypothetical protein A3A77_01070 [Candidatus Blackburnbacteria bacterium RIFCSPLOWO2_01_FULL_40_20]HBL52043.1 hypothetical protein [Candidatus Blackburnbact